jgi:hypothetical protein
LRRIEKAPAIWPGLFCLNEGTRIDSGRMSHRSLAAFLFDAAQTRAFGRRVFVSSMFEVVVEKRSQLRWDWRVCDRAGKTLVDGWEETRNAARYRGERALFQLLLLHVPQLRPPPAE